MAYGLPAEKDAVCVPRHVREALALHLVATLHPTDMLRSPLLRGFSCEVATLF